MKPTCVQNLTTLASAVPKIQLVTKKLKTVCVLTTPLSETAAVVPRQWKAARIMPVSTVTKPVQPSDFRPILITPSCPGFLKGRHIVKSYIYPALHQRPPGLCFSDQFAFRPAGSTTVALIALLHTVCLELCVSSPWTFPRRSIVYGMPF